MAVYTHVDAPTISALLDRYDVGQLCSAKGIAEGVENSNYLIDTDRARFILTLYEKRVDTRDLPFFIRLLDHLAQAGCPVPRMIADRSGTVIQQIAGRPACLIEFLSGVSLTEPQVHAALAVGHALAQMHRALSDFADGPVNPLGPQGWRDLIDRIGDRADDIQPGFAQHLRDATASIINDWPTDLPTSVIHADLFPDNVLMRGGDVSGLIDFYFACRDMTAYDFAVTHSAWCFSADGTIWRPDIAAALCDGYQHIRPLSPAEQSAFATLCRGAALRFTLTRTYDWLNTPADALVTRKDPLAFARRLNHYLAATSQELLHP